jgi:hypothetical protein
MESVSLSLLFDVLKNFGPIGLIAFMWWMDVRNMRKILDTYKHDMDEIRGMYEANVRLVEEQNDLGNRYALLAQDLKDAYIMTAQINQRLADSIESNQYCPMVRLEKRAKGVQE